MNWLKKTRLLRLTCALVCLPALLASCGLQPVKTKPVEVKIATYVPLDTKLTTHPKPPRDPAFRCKDALGRKTVCNEDSVNWGQAMKDALTKAYAQLDAIFELQPKEPLP